MAAEFQFSMSEIVAQRSFLPWLSRVAAMTLLGSIVGGYLGLVLTAAKNLPYADDYVVILDFVAQTREHGFSWSALLAEHNEHRLVFDRLAALGWWSVFGRVDFTALILLGNLGWIACGTMIAMIATRRAGTIWAAVPVAMIVAVPVHHENMLWAMAALQNYWCAALVVTSLYLISTNRPGLSLISCGAALLTSGGGFAAMAGVIGLPAVRGEWKRGAWLGLGCVLMVSLYLIGHQPAGHLHATTVSSIPAFLAAFLGNASPWPELAPYLGGGLGVVLIYVVSRYKRDSFASLLAGFVLITGLMTAWSRGGMGTSAALSSRYAIYSLIGLSCVWLAWLGDPRLNRHHWLMGVLLTGAALGATVGVFKTDRWQLQRAAMLIEYSQVTGGRASHAHVVPFLERAARLGIYQGPPTLAVSAALDATAMPEMPPVAGKVARACVDEFDGAYILGWAHLPGLDASSEKVTLILESENGIWSVPAKSYDRPDLDAVFKDGGSYFKSGFQAMLSLYSLPAGRYRVSVLVQNGDEAGLFRTDKEYQVPVPVLSHAVNR